VIEEYLNNIEKTKIKCRKNRFEFVECILQFKTLDNILVGLKLVNRTISEFSFGQTIKTNDSPSQEMSNFSLKMNYYDEIFNPNQKNSFIILNSIRLIKNHYSAEVIRSFTNYFYKKFLILIYEVASFVRVYFYYLGVPENKNSKMYYGNSTILKEEQSNTSCKDNINFCESANDKFYMQLYYRLELKLKQSRFLFLRFSYDLENAEEEESNSDLSKKKIVDIIKVVFDDRIETYVFNNQIKIKLKKATLDFDQIFIYAKNHNNMVKGRLCFVFLINSKYYGIGQS
jgi:hypothetical protein